MLLLGHVLNRKLLAFQSILAVGWVMSGFVLPEASHRLKTLESLTSQGPERPCGTELGHSGPPVHTETGIN